MKFKITLGYRCNMKCNYCYQLKEHCNTADISYEVIDKFLERFNKLEGVHEIGFFGGEPLLYLEKIRYILSRIDNRHEISITTNGSLRKEFYELEKLWGKPIINLLSNKEHKNYNKLNSESSFRYVVTADNIGELTDELVEFLGHEYKDRLGFKYDLTHKWELPEVQRMEEVQKILKRIIGMNYSIELPVDYNTSYDCFAHGQYCFIDSNGNYLGCHRSRSSVIGNIFDDDFKVSCYKECINKDNVKAENLYSYGSYEFKGLSLFCGCD